MKDNLFWTMVIEQMKLDFREKLSKRHMWSKNQCYEMLVATLTDVTLEVGEKFVRIDD